MNFKLIDKKEFDRIKNSDIRWRDKMQLLADMIRFNTLVAVKSAGSGHLGSSFSAADIITYIYFNEMNILQTGLNSPDRDIYFSSKGHDVPGLYSLFYALGIVSKEKLLRLRKLHGLDGHPEVRIPGIEASAGSLGMGISKAKGMAWAKNYFGSSGKVIVLTGDGEFQEGQIYESLQATAHQKINNVIAIMDHNKYQTDMLVDDVNRIEDIVRKVEDFGWYAVRIDGHNFEQLRDTFSAIEKISDKPKFIVADTVKGKGVSFMETPVTETISGKTYYKWHSGAPNNRDYIKGLDEISGRIISLSERLNIGKIDIPKNEKPAAVSSKADKEFVTEAYGEALLELAEVNDKFVVIDGDLSADCKLRPFEYKYPERFIENGIAEQDMVSMAGGLARMGIIPVVNTFASFLSSRANEQIYNNAGEQTKIIYTMHFAGIIPAGPGKSHQSVRDISLMGALPNMIIMQPCNSEETKKAAEFAIMKAKENCVIRLVIGPSPERIILPENYEFKIGCGAKLTEGGDAVLFGYGPVMLHEALSAARMLRKENFNLRVINMPWLNRINVSWLEEAVSNSDKIYVLEDHSNIGGLGDRLLDALVKNDLLRNKKFIRLGLDDYPECGAPWEVLNFHGLDGKSIADKILGSSVSIDESVKSEYTDEAPQ